MTEAWIERNRATDQDRREYEQERLIARALDTLYGLMEDANLAQGDLARSLGTSRAHITQVFRGTRNITLRTLGDLAWACGYRVDLVMEPLRPGEFMHSAAKAPKVGTGL